MRYYATMSAWDMLDKVHVSASVHDLPRAPGEAAPLVLEVSTTVQGVGESDERVWLRDALIALAETL